MMWWALIGGCWAVSFLFSGIEAGLLSIDPVRLRALVKQKRRRAQRLERLLRHPERLLVTVLLVTNMANIVALMTLTALLVRAYGNPGFLLSVAVSLPIYLFFLSVLPKDIFRRLSVVSLSRLAGVLETTEWLLWPILYLGARIGRLMLPRRLEEAPRLFAAREELKQIAEQSEREGVLTATERKMIQNVVDFTGVKVRDVMVALADVISVRPQTPVREVLELSRRRDVERLPVISEKGEAVALVTVLDVLFDPNRSEHLSRHMRRLITAQEDEAAYRVIRRLRAARLSLAAVVDRRRKLVGIVTAEDMIKRLMQSA